jgi:hypothetical protein
VDDAGDVTKCRRCLDERVNRFARRDVDGLGGDVEAGVSNHLCRGVGVLAVEVGQHDLLPGAHAPGDRLADRSGSDDDNDLAQGALLTCDGVDAASRRQWLN